MPSTNPERHDSPTDTAETITNKQTKYRCALGHAGPTDATVPHHKQTNKTIILLTLRDPLTDTTVPHFKQNTSMSLGGIQNEMPLCFRAAHCRQSSHPKQNDVPQRCCFLCFGVADCRQSSHPQQNKVLQLCLLCFGLAHCRHQAVCPAQCPSCTAADFCHAS